MDFRCRSEIDCEKTRPLTGRCQWRTNPVEGEKVNTKSSPGLMPQITGHWVSGVIKGKLFHLIKTMVMLPNALISQMQTEKHGLTVEQGPKP